MRKAAGALGACLLVHACLGGCLWPTDAAARSPQRLRLEAPPGAETAVRLIGQLWDSGFFRKCQAVRDEICNNDYAFFDPGSPLAALENRGMACFSQASGRKDTIYLRADIFSHFKVGMEGVLERRSVEPTALRVLVHELCHDFWANILDDRERAFFSMDGAEFIAGYRQAVTPEEKGDFLVRAGQLGRKPDLAKLVEDFDAFMATYPPNLLVGPELFAWFGEHAFSVKLEIPLPFRNYYSGFISAPACRPATALP
jgi:hypothetical protein